MLEAVTTDLVSPSAWSAAPKIFSYPQAAGRLPHLWVLAVWKRLKADINGCPYQAGSRLAEALYFAPHFGKRITEVQPGIERW